MPGTDIRALLVLAVCVVFFLTKWLPACVTGVAGCLAMVFLGVCSYQQAFSGFSSSITLLMASAMIVGIAMFKTGVAQIVGRTAVRLSGGDEKRFLFSLCALGGLLSMFFANTAIVAVMIPVIESVCAQPGSQMKRLHLVLPMTLAVMIGGAGTLVGCTPQLTANGMLKSLTGIEMTMWTLTGPMFGMFACWGAYMLIAGYRQGCKVFLGREERQMDIDPERVEAIRSARHDPRQVRLMFVLLTAMIVSYVVGVIPVAYTAMITAIMCIATGCCTVTDVKRELNWETVVFLASCLGIAEAMTVSGAGETIGRWVNQVAGNVHSPFALFAMVVLLTLVLSQFITNSTAIIIVLPIGLSMCSVYGMNSMAFCVGITLAASVACCTPLAAAQITMTQVAGYEFRDYLSYCLPSSIVMYLAILAFVPLFYPLAG